MTRQDYASAAGEAVAERVAARRPKKRTMTRLQKAVVARVARRLDDVGPAELVQLNRLNGYELEVLVRLELGWGPISTGPSTETGSSTENGSLIPNKSPGYASGTSQPAHVPMRSANHTRVSSEWTSA